MTEPGRWAAMPFHFWSVAAFVFGSVVGSFLNVCIHRVPRGESIVSPPSHCPRCGRAIPWYLNVPLVSWVWLRGRCAFCRAPITVRYFLVELLTAGLFLSCWLAFGRQSVALALAYCLMLAGLIVASFVDVEHLIIPDGLTLGGIVAGFLCSFVAPELHRVDSILESLQQSALGMITGGGVIYLFLRLGKVLFGRQKLKLPPDSPVVFTETALVLPDREIPYEDLFYRKSDAVELHARFAELADRGYREVPVRLTQTTLAIGSDRFDTETVPCLEVVTSRVTVPREAMGLGDVKFMAAIGAFLGWPGVVFSLMTSAMIGSVAGLSLIALRRRAWSSRIPYGPYIALAAMVWIFARERLLRWWQGFPMLGP